MKSLSWFLPGLTARKGFYDPRASRRPLRPGSILGRAKVLKSSKILFGASWAALGFLLASFFLPLSPSGCLLPGQGAAGRSKDASGIDFGSHFGSFFTHFLMFFGVPFSMRFQALFFSVLHPPSPSFPLRAQTADMRIMQHPPRHLLLFQGALSRRRRQQGEENDTKNNPKQHQKNDENRCFLSLFSRCKPLLQKCPLK